MKVGPHLANDFARALLMRRIAEGEQITNRDRGDALLRKGLDSRSHRLLIQWNDDRTIGSDAFRNAVTPTAWREEDRSRRLQEKIVQVRPFVAADFENILEAVGCQQTCHRALLLNQRVDGYSAAIN